jgi:hypothetical protein
MKWPLWHSGVPRGVWGGGVVKTPPPKFWSFNKAEPNSQFHGKYIHNKLIRIWVSPICKLSTTPDKGVTATRFLLYLPSVLNWICRTRSIQKKISVYVTAVTWIQYPTTEKRTKYLLITLLLSFHCAEKCDINKYNWYLSRPFCYIFFTCPNLIFTKNVFYYFWFVTIIVSTNNIWSTYTYHLLLFVKSFILQQCT